MIDRETVDRIYAAANIVDIIGEYVTLKRKGVNYVACCPFHNEKTPSFVVSPSKGLYKCFGCGKGGNAVTFVMDQEATTYAEALKMVAKRYGIEVKEKEMTEEEVRRNDDRESMFALNGWAAEYFANYLQRETEGQSVGLAYFRQKRGMTDATIRKFGLGFCPAKGDRMSKDALAAGYKQEFLVSTGLSLVSDRDGSLYDRFRARVIFPLHNISGRIVAFGGRTLRTDKQVAKYQNSPESEIYSKKRELYGLYFAKKAIQQQDFAIMVEGYTDVISMHQAGVENVVASSGTALTQGQIRLIHRFTSNITVLYDGDAAGIKASIRGIDMLLEEGMNIKVCLLPDGDDPDSFARKHNSTEFQQFIQEHETDFIRFKTNLLLEDAGKDPIKRAELIGNLVQSISVIPEAIVRDVYIKECAQLLRVEDKLLVSEVAKRREMQAEKRAEQTERERRNAVRSAEGAPNAPKVEGSNPATPTTTNGAALPTGEAAGYDTNAPFPPEDNYISFIPQEGKEGQEFYKYERLILQMIVRYGEKIMCNATNDEGQEVPISVIEYVINDLKEDELSFHNPLHRQILTEAAAHIHDEGFTAERYFLAHPEAAISKLSVELISNRYQLSKYHSKSQKIVTDEERLYELVPALMINFKYAIVSEELKHMMSALQDPVVANNEEKCNAIMKRYSEMREVQRIMAKRLGDRVVLP